MSSVKRIKSKSKGRFGVAGMGAPPIIDYDYRRAAFVAQAPIIVRPLRTVKAWAQAAARDLNEKMTRIMATNPNASATEVGGLLREEFAETRKRMEYLGLATTYAKGGAGGMVRFMAGRIA